MTSESNYNWQFTHWMNVVFPNSYDPHSWLVQHQVTNSLLSIQIPPVLRRPVHGRRPQRCDLSPCQELAMSRDAEAHGTAEAAETEASNPSCSRCRGGRSCLEDRGKNRGCCQRNRSFLVAVIGRGGTERWQEQLHKQSFGWDLTGGGGLPLLWCPAQQGVWANLWIFIKEPRRYSCAGRLFSSRYSHRVLWL